MSELYDLVIVGGGIAGMCAALATPPDARIVVIDKGEATAGSSPLAQGGIAAAVGNGDSPSMHAGDTIAAGAGLCDEVVVEDITSEGPRAIAWLAEQGCAFDRDANGAIHLAREGGQSVARSVHWRDATGAEIVRALRERVRARHVERVADRARKLLLREGRCVGVLGDRRYVGRATLIATGGAGALWAATTNAAGATADGIVLAAEARAQLADLEFMQFHPTALATPGAHRVLLTEALRGHGAHLVNARGERFVDELAPRHVVAKAILDEGGAFLDCRHIADLETLFPTVVAGARMNGFDPADQPLPVEPAAHYFIGGVAADARGRTSIDGLFAAGECASTGMHGANRMAGNSLLETVVVGRRVGARAMDEPQAPADTDGWFDGVMETMELITDAHGRDITERIHHQLLGEPAPALARIMWEGVGPIRHEKTLDVALQELSEMVTTPHRDFAMMIARAAAARLESRGVHIRSDHRDPDDAYAFRSFDRRAAGAR